MARESTGIGEAIRVTRSVAVPRREIELRFSRSSGPGGQHAQRTETRVEAVFDVAASSALTERQKQRVIAKAGPVLRAVAQDERSQWRNRELAVERLVDALRAALEVTRSAEADEARASGRAGATARRQSGGEASVKRLRQPPETRRERCEGWRKGFVKLGPVRPFRGSPTGPIGTLRDSPDALSRELSPMRLTRLVFVCAAAMPWSPRSSAFAADRMWVGFQDDPSFRWREDRARHARRGGRRRTPASSARPSTGRESRRGGRRAPRTRSTPPTSGTTSTSSSAARSSAGWRRC